VSLEVGFIGLGNMGSALASNLVAAGHPVLAHDVSGPQNTPEGATFVPAVAEIARLADVVVFSLPDGRICELVARELVVVPQRRTRHVIDTSTVGVAAARTIAALLDEHGMSYVDAPVSGGAAGARSRTLAVMYAGTDEACAHVQPVLAGLSDRLYRVSDRPGAAQALKLANNFLSATALAATSEAVAFGQAAGLEINVMLDVLNNSSGSNTATSDKFPNHVVNGRFASGFANSLMSKDVQLYLAAAGDTGVSTQIGSVTASVWEQFAAAQPGADFTRIFPFVRDS
jgi:3-hydroxyisobutyrate dehydrogenase